LNNFSLGDDKEYPRKKVNQDGLLKSMANMGAAVKNSSILF